MVKLSARAWELLLLIDEACDDSGRFFVPSAYEVSCRRTGNTVWVSGAGDVKIIKSLESKGLVRPKKLANYACQITEDGRLAIEQGIEQGSIPLELRY